MLEKPSSLQEDLSGGEGEFQENRLEFVSRSESHDPECLLVDQVQMSMYCPPR